MTEILRVLKLENSYDSFMQMAIDEAILIAVSQKKSKETLRFYKWKNPAVSIGYFQSVFDEVQIDECKKNKLEIFRRMTGGGAVFKDPNGEFNYSIVLREDSNIVSTDILKSYEEICTPLIKSLKSLDLDAQFSGINDIVISYQKISGNSQTRKDNTILQHGTILLDFDVKKMAKYLKISKEKLSDKMISNIEERVTSLRKFLPNLKFDSLMENIISEFEKTFNVKFVFEELSDFEKEKAKELYLEKYSKNDWNFMR